MTNTQWKTQHGDRKAEANQILRTTVGSEVHGIALKNATEDHDEMGVYIEPPTTVMGIREGDGHYTARTQPEGARSRHGDVDLSLYSLRRFLALAATGHPTVLLPLFAPDSDVLFATDEGRALRKFGPQLLSRQAGDRFRGYMRGQLNRVAGQDKRHVPNRPELIAAHGYDTKYAAHALRLAMQGVEVMSTGRLTLPMPEPERGYVIAVKRGDVTLDKALAWIERWAGKLDEIMDERLSPLPERPSLVLINNWSVDMHYRYWGLE